MTKRSPVKSLSGTFASVAPLPPVHSRGRRYSDDSGGRMPWLMTFTDVMALMLTFFVLLFSMSEPIVEDFSDLMAALNNEFNTFYGRTMSAGPEDTVDIARIDFDHALDIRYLEALMQAVIDRNEVLRDNVTMRARGDHIMISLPHDLLFDVGSAELKEGSTRAIFALGGTFSRMKNALELVGHADPRPVAGDRGASGFASNWDLSLARAAAVAAALERVGYIEPVIVRGSSDGRYQDLEGIDDENERLGLSRRVDIVIMNHDGRRR